MSRTQQGRPWSMNNQVTAHSLIRLPCTFSPGTVCQHEGSALASVRLYLPEVKSVTAIPGNCQEHQIQCMSRKKSKQRSLSVPLDLMTMTEMSFSWLLSLMMYFPDANSISETIVVTQRQVGSTLNEFILDVRVQFPADQLPAAPGSKTCIICELLYGLNPRSCY